MEPAHYLADYDLVGSVGLLLAPPSGPYVLVDGRTALPLAHRYSVFHFGVVQAFRPASRRT